MARRKFRFPKVLGVSLPIALIAGYVGYRLVKGRGGKLAGMDEYGFSPRTPFVPVGQPRAVTPTFVPTTPFASVPSQLTPGGRGEDIKARIRAGWPINQIVGRA